MKRICISAVLLVVVNTSFAQKITPEEYIAKYKDLAIREMKRMGVPAAITLAQGLLETESGNSDLVKKSNNHFGIKCKSTWTGNGVRHDDDAPSECFRTYKDAEGSYRDHSNFLRGSDRYAFLFRLSPADYKGWSNGLRKAGYATNPQYPQILIKNIEQYNLQQYTLAAINDVPKFNSEDYQDDKEQFISPADTSQVKDGTNVNYPTDADHIAIVNGNKCILGKKGVSLLLIATNHNINLSKLLEFNDLEEDGILEEDQLIFLQKKSKKGAQDFYIAQAGDDLYDIAQKNGVQLDALLDYNQLNPDEQIAPGTRINLKPTVEVAQVQTAVNKTADPIIHEVQPKEGLYSISKKYSVSIEQIKSWNNLEGDELKVGQQLVVSQ